MEIGDRETHGELWEAARSGDLQQVRVRLEDGAEVDERGQSGKTSLGIACGMGHVEVAKLLVEYGADLEARDRGRCTPLLHASQCRDRERSLDMVRFLLEAGADLSAADDNGDTAISYAYRSSRGRVLKYLVGIEGAPLGDVLKGVSRQQLEDRIEELLDGGYF